MKRVYNFSAGPAMLPKDVLEKAAGEMVDYKGTGMSVMEMSHRGSDFKAIIEKAGTDLRDLMRIPDNYKVLFLQGGASLQFAMVPLNIMKNGKADYVHTGQWTKKAMVEAKKLGDVNVVASSEDRNFTCIPELDPGKFSKDADYFYIVTNNTIYGTRYAEPPRTGDIPLVADMSSNILSEPVDVSRFGIIFAGAQKNIGPAGVTIVVIREDLVGKAGDNVPTLLDYQTHVDKESMFNTPPCYSIYMAGLVFEWLKEKGGLERMKEINMEKADMLYEYLDSSEMFNSPVEKGSRSIMNVPFVTGDPDLDARFVEEAAKEGLKTLKGHRTVGGMRASIYNAMPVEGVKALVDFMERFEKENR
jgi:phosphoserine aminotransferase